MNPDPATPPRPFLPSWLRWHDWLTALGTWLNSSRWESGYVVLLLGFVLVYQLASPIVLGDTDMWYHLNGGRYFWENGAVPVTPFFSFNDPERTWINYFWGFQALVYKVYGLSGYQGLVVLRALLVFACLVAIWRVIAGFRQPQTAGLALLVLLALYVILIDGRAHQLRPHLFSYCFIAIFIYVLEHRPRLAFLLPPLTVLWANLHGIEYIVAALIGGAYLLEFVVDWRRDRPQRAGRDWRYATSILACAPALLLNPHGLELLLAPFAPPRDIVQYINEMRPLSWEALTTFTAQGGEFSAQSAFALLFAFFVYAVVSSLVARRFRVSHLALAGGGLILLTQGTRFIWEWALLALPLLAAQAAALRERPVEGHGISPTRSIGLALLLVPAIALGSRLDLSRPYPFDSDRLPVGTVQFLQDAGASGNLLMYPSLAGYVHWMLAPKVRVYSDMETPPFNDWDMYRVAAASWSKDAFQRLIAEYPVDFLLLELGRSRMDSFARESDYVPVFLDDVAVLYAHRKRQAALVSEHELKAVNPFSMMDTAKPLDERLPELTRLYDAFPAGGRTLHALTRLLADAKRYEEAETWADRFIEHQPRDPNSHFLKGVILENTDRCREAAAYFERVFPLAGADFDAVLHRHQGSCAYLTKNFAAAYEHFGKSVNIYKHNEAPETLYQYAYAAVVAGDTDRARILLKAILYQTPDKETHIRERAQGLLAQIESDASLEGNLLDRLLRALP